MRKSHVILLVFCFVVLEVALMLWVDLPLSEYTRGLDGTQHEVINFFRALTDYAKSKWYLWPSGVGIIGISLALHTRMIRSAHRHHMARTGQHFLFFFISIGLSGIVTDILKPIIGRARPVEWERAHIYGFQPFTFQAVWNGMPSGHATTAAALACALGILYPRGRFLWIVIGTIFAVSRVMVNAHYLSDVVAGTAVGILTTLWLARLRNDQGTFPYTKGIFPIDKPGTLS